ncbi:uncharacterized protein LOC113226232 [Hyposmocoma kahamanoa]|uniref:uncharacterized protein LOC113226232 n=1 Tax=Hyposmocoma kahamanoa TaxID=1477025 RepID=UPI000E6D7288|nr:uncharacterized protein LOC113226232 [Hyposmocoma kahamanoa]
MPTPPPPHPTRSLRNSLYPGMEQLVEATKSGNSNTPLRQPVATDDEDAHEESDTSFSRVTVRDTRSQRTYSSVQGAERSEDQEELIVNIREQVIAAIKLEVPELIKTIIKNEFSPLKNDFRELCKSFDFLSGKYDELCKSISTITEENIQLKKTNLELQTSFAQLSSRVNDLEQHLRENNLEIHGVPESRSENIPSILQQCASTVGHQVGDTDIVNYTRVARQNKDSQRPRAIIVKFRSVRCRDEFYSAVHRFNKSNPKEKLNTTHLGFGTVKTPVYVSEHLSPENKSLHAAVRIAAKEKGYKFVWVRGGRIYIRKTPDSQYILIKNRDSLKYII